MSTRSHLDFVEPDDSELFAAERASEAPSQYRSLVVLVTDSTPAAGEDTGALVTELLREADFAVDGVVEVNSSQEEVRYALETAVVGGADLVVTVGGTGVGARDRTPEATEEILDQKLPGIAQALRTSALGCGSMDGATSRGIAGVSGSTVVVNIAGSRGAIRDGMAALPALVNFVIGELRAYQQEER